jgi:hypothetical protein
MITEKKMNGFNHLGNLNVGREFKNNILASQLAVDRSEGVELVFQRGGILGIQEARTTPKFVRYCLSELVAIKLPKQRVLTP